MSPRVLIPPRTELPLKIAAFAAAFFGVVLRLYRAATLGLNADEALHLLPIHAGSFPAAIAQFLQFHHPPLPLVLTYLIRPLTLEEFGARLISVLAGSLLPFVLYLWLRPRAGDVAACTILALTALSQSLITLSPQVRSYSLAFFGTALTLLLLDRAIDASRLRLLLLAGIAWSLAIMSDYSLAIVSPAIALYGFVRLRDARSPGSLWTTWALTIALALATFGFLYWLQIRHFPEVATDFAEGWLHSGFREPGESLPYFLYLATTKQFAYLAGSLSAGLLLAACFLLALFSTSFAWRILLAAPVVTGLALSLLRLLPFGRTRHSAVVSIFLAAGVALAAQRWLAPRSRAWHFAGPALAFLCFATARPDFMDRPDAQLDRAAFRAASTYAGTLATPDTPLLATGEARLLLQYYRLIRHEPPLPVTGNDFGSLPPQFFERSLAALRQRQALSAGRPVYFVDGGYFPVRFPPSLSARPLRRFGLLSFWELRAPAAPTPAASPTSPPPP